MDEFAGEFFGYPPGEAELIDPQQRIFLEACWEALESAGHPARDGHRQVAVFAGASFSTYATLLYLARARTAGAAALNDVDLYLGGVTDFLASRVAYRLGLHGPSVAVQTACSSSLTAVHYATLSLLAGECDLALAGGTGLETLDSGYRYQPGGLLSEDGYCRAFDRRSTGTARGCRRRRGGAAPAVRRAGRRRPGARGGLRQRGRQRRGGPARLHRAEPGRGRLGGRRPRWASRRCPATRCATSRRTAPAPRSATRSSWPA